MKAFLFYIVGWLLGFLVCYTHFTTDYVDATTTTEEQCLLEKQSGEVCKLNVEYIAVKQGEES